MESVTVLAQDRFCTLLRVIGHLSPSVATQNAGGISMGTGLNLQLVSGNTAVFHNSNSANPGTGNVLPFGVFLPLQLGAVCSLPSPLSGVSSV